MADIRINGKKLRNVKLVIFDRDGTLIDLYHYWSQMIGMRAELISRRFKLKGLHKDRLMFAMGIDTKNKKLRTEGPVGIKKREIVMQAAIDYLGSIGMKDGHQTCIEVFKEVDELSKSKLSELIKPLDGMYQMIDALIQKGCKIAIATTDKTERARLSMEHLQLTEKVDYVVGADSVKHSKPAPDMINLILEQLEIDKAYVVMVGDAETDIEMGKNAGILASIAVCSGITPCPRLKKLTEHVISDISKIKVI